MRIGIISDTHGLLRPEAVKALKGVDAILHAGDVGNKRVLEGLKEVAPLTVVSGNVDSGISDVKLPPSQAIKFGSVNIYMLHDIEEPGDRSEGSRVPGSGLRSLTPGEGRNPKGCFIY